MNEEPNVDSQEVSIPPVKKVIDVASIIKELNLNDTVELCANNGISINQVEELTAKNYAYSDLEKEIKPLKDQIKNMLIDNCVKKGTFGKVNLSMTFQNRDFMDEEALVNLLNERGLSDATMIVVKPDVSKLKQLLIDGLITDEDLQNCMVPNKIAVLNFPRRKKVATSISTAPKESVADLVKKSVEQSSKKGMF